MTKSIKNVIVIGATGLVGLELLKQLNELESCEKITAIVRHENLALQYLNKVQQYVLDDFLLLNDQDVAGFDHAFSCLGTTLKKAGSKEKFYHTDFEINAHFADLLELKDTHFILVSSIGADPQSKFFYNRVKGELEQHILQLCLYKTSIIRPSLLLGQRAEKRLLEDATQKIYELFSSYIPRTFKYKPVTAQQVASMLLHVAQKQSETIRFYESTEIVNRVE
ncbi:nucleoside-diphosphate sugar epimerase [Acinetobacter equi]|uniref:Nucleoside-diphosphate sugar epimerase n=1 Tax=Acinetobacter equi TaxID=1324350 RepID=A0A0N9W072_9GAMM|nr:nucleoside-diphosphate sugar epimerase [Acinetobacter equi]ALH95905.1 nucleoside-diphosphate sugar epimerase [Acinetobacter equi]